MKKNENKSVSKNKKNETDKARDPNASLKKEPLNTTDLEEVTGGVGFTGPWQEC